MREIEYSAEAGDDIFRLNEYIADECKSPLTACRYLSGLENRILWLKQNADVFPDVPELSIQLGCRIKRLNYEKMAILYSVEESIVTIHRIIPQGMVIY